MLWLKQHKWLIISVVLAFTVRLALIHFNPRGTFLENTGIDYLSQSLAQGNGYGYAAHSVDDTGYYKPFWGYPPGTASIYALMYLIFGLTTGYSYADSCFTYTRIFQSLIDSFGCVLIYLICKELFNNRVGIIAAFIYAIFLPIAFMSTWVAHDALMPFLTLCALYCFVLGIKRSKWYYYALSGLSIGASCYFQPTTILLPFIFSIGYFVYSIYKNNLKVVIVNTIKNTLIIFAVMAIVITPWMVRNSLITGTFTPMRSCMWITFYCGFAEFGDAPNGLVLDDQAELKKAWADIGHRFDWASKEYEDYFRAKTIEFVKEHPGFVAYTVTRRIPRGIFYKPEMGLSNYPYWDKEAMNGGLMNEEYFKEYPQIVHFLEMVKSGKVFSYIKNYPRGATTTGVTLLYIMLPVLLAITGIVVYRRQWRILVLVSTIPLYYFLVSIFILTINAKNKVPGYIGYIMLSSLAIYWIYCKIRKKSFT